MLNEISPKEFYEKDVKIQLKLITDDMRKRANEISNVMYEKTPTRADIIAGDSNLMTAWQIIILKIIEKIE